LEESVSTTLFILYLLLTIVSDTHLINADINKELCTYFIFITTLLILLLLLTTNWFTPGGSVLQFKTEQYNKYNTKNGIQYNTIKYNTTNTIQYNKCEAMNTIQYNKCNTIQ
jgi:hypothetical protein